MWEILAHHGKTIVAVVTAVVGFATLVILSPGESVSAVEYLTGATMLLTALGVYVVPNGPKP